MMATKFVFEYSLFVATVAITFLQDAFTQDLPAVAEIYHDTGTIMEGQETTFFCLVDNLRPGHLVQFSHNDVTLTSNSQVTAEEKSLYSILRVDSRSFTRFYLTVTSATRKANGRYGCHVLQSAKNTTVLSSSYVDLSVYYLPLSPYPSCLSEPETDDLTFLAGDKVSLTCLSAGGNPPISLNWEGLGSSSTSSSSTTVSADGLMVNKLTLQPQDGAVITCRLNFNTDIFIGESSRNCSIGPFTILPKPKVALEPFNVVAQVGSTAQFRCTVNDVPETARVYREWSTSPTVPSDRFFLSLDKTIALVQNISESDNKTVVTCRASTILGSVEAFGMLTVTLKYSSTSSSCKTTQENIESPIMDAFNSTTTQKTSNSTEAPMRQRYNSSRKPSKTTQSTLKNTKQFVNKQQTVIAHKQTMDPHDQGEVQERRQTVDDYYQPFIVAIIVVSLVALLALVADILLLVLVLKLFRCSKSVNV